MLKAIISGRVWCTKRLPEIPAGSLLEVSIEGTNSQLVAFDPLGCGDGERVIVATGSVAAAWFAKAEAPPVDALIVGSIDEPARTRKSST